MKGAALLAGQWLGWHSTLSPGGKSRVSLRNFCAKVFFQAFNRRARVMMMQLLDFQCLML